MIHKTHFRQKIYDSLLLILNISRSDVSVSLNFQKNAEFLDIGQVNPWKRFIVQKSIPLYLKIFKTG